MADDRSAHSQVSLMPADNYRQPPQQQLQQQQQQQQLYQQPSSAYPQPPSQQQQQQQQQPYGYPPSSLQPSPSQPPSHLAPRPMSAQQNELVFQGFGSSPSPALTITLTDPLSQPSPSQDARLSLQQNLQTAANNNNNSNNNNNAAYRVARPNVANNMNGGYDDGYKQNNNQGGGRPSEQNKPPSYYSYPPQQPSDSNHQHDLYRQQRQQQGQGQQQQQQQQAGGYGQKSSASDVVSKFQKLWKFPCSTTGKYFMVLIGIEALLVIIFQAIIVQWYFSKLNPETAGSQLNSSNQSRAIPAYLIVFVFAQLFQLVLAWDAVRAQNTIELIGIVVFNLCCFAYSVFEISQITTALNHSEPFLIVQPMELSDSLRPFLLTVAVVIGITECLVIWLAYRLFQEFGWKIYKKIGADPIMKLMYRTYQIYLVLIKVDLFFFVGFSIQFIYLTLTRRGNDAEYYLTIAVLPCTPLILYIAVYAVRHESRRWMSAFIFSMLCGVAYFIFKVVRMYVGDKVSNYEGIRYFLTLFASICLLSILATIANAAVCFRNFGKGLKSHIMREGSQEEEEASGGAAPGRVMEID